MSAPTPIAKAPLSTVAAPQFRSRLLTWYEQNARRLPWRETQDPYCIWLSEVMLQQTRVAAVLDHYRAFLQRFPTVKKLAAAREASVLAAWSGLGYYRRARMLHAAAKVIVHQHGGIFPSTAAGLEMLPGIGRYTAAAIASIAFGEPCAVVDGNVERVLRRVLGRELKNTELWQTADDLLDPSRPGDFNQAVMELGATVCTPRAPTCLTCPVIDLCATRGELQTGDRSPPQRKVEIHYALVRRNSLGRDDAFLVQRNRRASLMPGMWELPEIGRPVPKASLKAEGDLRVAKRSSRAWHSEQRKESAFISRRDALLFTLRHSITVTDYTVHVWNIRSAPGVRGQWIPSARLAKLPLTGLARKILRRTHAAPS